MRWLKYDLHMHGYASRNKDSNVKKIEAEDLLKMLIDKNIDVFSLTDHNTYDSQYYNDLYKCITEKYIDKIKLIPGAELDVSIKMNNGEIKYLNILFYFYENYPDLSQTLDKLYETAKPQLKEIIDSFNEKRYKFLIIPEGTGDRGITEFIKDMDPDVSRYFNIQGMYKIFGGFDKTVKDTFNAEIWALGFYEHSQELKDILDKTGMDKKTFLEKVFKKLKHGEKLNSKTEIDFVNNIKKYSSFLARFKFSDWHNKDDYNPKYYNHIFGDFDKPFDSFELSLIDPESRLIVNKVDKIEKNNTFLKTINFKLNGEEYNLEFTEGLNVIIGERGSGKSLLHSILKSLKDGEESYKKYMKRFKVQDVNGKLVNEQQVSPNQNYNSIEIIEQTKVEDYFEKQPDLKIYLKDNFKKLEYLDLSILEDIQDKLNNIEYDIKTDDNIGPLLSNITETKGYIVNNNAQLKDFSSLSKIASESITYIDKFIAAASLLGYSTVTLLNAKSDYKSGLNIITKNASLIEDFKSDVNKILKNYISESERNLNRTQNAYKLIDDYLRRVNDYFSSHLNNYKLLYLINNFKIDIPKASYNVHDLGYIFRSRSKIKNSNNIKEEIKNEILSTVFRGNYDDFDNELKNVIRGEKNLNKNKDPKSSVEKYIEKLDVSTELHVFKLNDEISIKDIQINDDLIEEWIQTNKIETVTEGSLGTKTVAYLDFAFDTSNNILLFDQPEDNIDNLYIASRLVDIIKKKKKEKQMIFVTHNPSIAVYADAFNYILSEHVENNIVYCPLQITSREAKEKILNTLDGGKFSFSNRNNKYGNIIGGIDYED